MNLTRLLKKAFDYEHWLDPCLQSRDLRELWLEPNWPINSTSGAPSSEPHRERSDWLARAANTQL